MRGEITLKVNILTMRPKIIWMLLSAFGILSSFLFQSCVKCKANEECELVFIKNYQYSNQTSYSIDIHRYRRSFDNGNGHVHKLSPLGKIEFKREFPFGCYIDDIRQDVSNNCFLIFADSIRIVFDNSRSYWLKHSDSVDVNILHHVNYNLTRQGIRRYYLYTFTEKDYNYAEPIEKED